MRSRRFFPPGKVIRRGVLIIVLYSLLLSILPPAFEISKESPSRQPDQSSLASLTVLTINTSPNLLESAIIDSRAGYGYFGTTDSPAMIFKVRLSDFTLIANLTLAPGETAAQAAAIDTSTDIAYFGTYSGQIVKLDLTSFTEAASISPGLGGITAATIDSDAGLAYFGTDTGNIVKVRLSTFTVEKTLPLGAPVGMGSAVLDRAHGYGYFGGSGCGLSIYYTPPNTIAKVRLSDFNITARLDPGQDCLATAMLDLATGFVYFTGASSAGSHLLRIQVSDFTIAGVLTPEPLNAVSSFVIDPGRGIGYIGEGAAYFATFRLSDLNQIGSVYTQDKLYNLRTAVLDPTTGDVYFTARQLPFSGGIQSNNAIARFPPSSLPSNDFTLTPTPSTLSLQEGSVGAAYINIESNNYTGNVSLAADTSSIYAPKPTVTILTPLVDLNANGENSSIFAVSAPIQDDVPASPFIVTVTGSSGSMSRTISILVTVTPGPIDFQLYVSPDSIGLHPGEAYAPSIALGTHTGFSGIFNFTARVIGKDILAGPMVSISPASTQENLPRETWTGVSNVFISTDLTTATGQYEIDVTATSGTVSHTASLCLLVVPSGVAQFCVLSRPNQLIMGPGQTRTSLIALDKTLRLFSNTYLGTVSMSASTLPGPSSNMVQATLNPSTFNLPNEIPGPQTVRSILTVTASPNTPSGQYTIQVNATNGTVTGSVNIPVIVTPGPLPGVAGLFPGDWAEYHIFSTLETTTSGSPPPIPGLSQYLNAYGATLKTGITLGDDTANLLSIGYLNGTQNSQSIQGNTLTDPVSLFPWVIGSNLSFNTTDNRIYAGASRLTSTLSLTRTNGTVTSTGTWTWDMQTGILLDYQLTVRGTGNLGSINGLVHIAMIDTNLWTPTQPYFTLKPSTPFLTVKQNAATKTTFSLTSLNGFSGRVGLTAQTLPINPTLSLSIDNSLNLQPGQASTATVTINPSSLGQFIILVNATSGTQFHSTLLDITVVTPTVVPLYLTITGVGPSPVKAGDTVTISFTVNNPDTASHITIDWGDGTTTTNIPGSVTSQTHVYNTAGTYTITITATDNTGTTTQPATKTITVNSKPATTTPAPTIIGASPIMLYGIIAAVIATIIATTVIVLTTKRGRPPPIPGA